MVVPSEAGYAVVIHGDRTTPLAMAITAALATGRLAAGVRSQLVALRQELRDVESLDADGAVVFT